MKTELSATSVIKLLLLLGLIAWSFLIVRPFIIFIIWAIILAVAIYPLFTKWTNKFKSKKTATTIFALGISIILFVPTYYITAAIVESTKLTVQQIKDENLQIPPPQESVKEWPLIGENLYTEWDNLSSNAREYAIEHKDVILEQGKNLFSGVTGFIGTMLAFIVSFLIAVAFMYNAEGAYNTGKSFFHKIVGDNADEILKMSASTIRSVVKGILLVAIIQAVLGLIGFKMIGLPAAGIFAFIILVTAIVQIPAILTMIPAIIIAFSIADTTPAVIFSIYSIIVALSDNVLKPMLLGKGLETPMILILMGAIGGMLLHGIIGLFVGAVVIAVAHRLYMYWVQTPEATA